MTRKEIVMEMEACKAKIDSIHKQLDSVEEFEKRMKLIDEMVELADRMSKLDSMNKEILMTEHQICVHGLFLMLEKMFKK